MKYETEHINGDLLVEHDGTFGGNVEVQGDMVINHSLRIKGAIEADNFTGANKGYFMTVDDLLNEHPMPDNGWMAGVMGSDSGEKAVFYAYIARHNHWVNTGRELSTGNISMSEVIELIKENQKEPIPLTQDEEDATKWYAALAFHPNSESLMVNGVHYYKPDYSLIEHDGSAIGVIIPFYEEGWEVKLVADIVE